MRWVVSLWILLGCALAMATDELDAESVPVPLALFDEGALPAALIEAARRSVNEPLAVRMKEISDPLLGRPYVIDGNGEGVGPDTDPPARYDVFDCVTFLEEVLALAMAPDPMSAPRLRNELRYKDGVVAYEQRNHFMLQEWIPNNIEAGFFDDISATLGETHLLDKEVSRQTWRNWAGTRLFSLSPNRLPVGRFTLPVLSLDAAARADFPPGAVVFTVRRPVDWKPIVVSHVGFVLPDSTVPMMRHSTKMGGGGVKDHLLSWYIDHTRWYANRPVEGLSVLMPKEQGPRRSARLAEAGEERVSVHR